MWVKTSAAVAFLASGALAGTIRDDRSDSSYRDLGRQFFNVGEIRYDLDGGGSFRASGTLIGSEWVLTAGHVVDAGRDIDSLTFQLDGQTVTGRAWRPHPDWDGDLTDGNDIGLIRLSAPITSVPAAGLYYQSKESGKVAVFTGYGATGDGDEGYDNDTGGTLRGGQNRIDARGRKFKLSNNILLMDFDAPRRSGGIFNPINILPGRSSNVLGAKNPVDLEYCIAPGDSGGGVFLYDKKLGYLLAGVNSFGGSFIPPWGDALADSSYGDYFGATRVSAYTNWIESQLSLGDAFTTPDNIADHDDTITKGRNILFPFAAPPGAVPEPAGAAWLIGASALLATRRRR